MRVMSVRAKPIIAESYRHHEHQKYRKIPFTRERSKVRSLVRPPELIFGRSSSHPISLRDAIAGLGRCPLGSRSS